MVNKKVTDITIFIPSLNPDEKFHRTLDSILEKGFHNIVVVDDGSDQNHKEPFLYAEAKGCKVLVHPTNKGKGRALKTAFEYCLQQENCIGVITVDGDGQHGAEDIYRCGLVMLDVDKVVLGCRDFSEPQVPFKSKYGNNITKFAFRVLCRIKISDTQTGLRAVPIKYLPVMPEISGERFEYETNMLLEMKSKSIPWIEQKIETIYLDENASSHFHPFRDSWRIYKIIFKYSLSARTSKES
jgi:glycosyltransferase involved in cell wall biosynthesis